MRHARIDYQRIQDPAGLIPEDEPVFLIRGQDKAAPAAIRAYAQAAELIGAEDDLIDLCWDWATEIEGWQAANRSKVPDL